jgi:hypothetical protein
MRARRPSHWLVLAKVAEWPAGAVLRGRERQVAFTLTNVGLLRMLVDYNPTPEDDGLTLFVVTDKGRAALAARVVL